MSTLEYCEVWSDYPQAGGTRTRFLPRPTSATDTVDLEDGTEESAASWPRSLSGSDALVYGAVVAFCFSNGTKVEQEIVEQTVASGAGDPTVQVRLVGPQERLRRLPLEQVDGDGFVFQEVPVVGLAPSTVVAQHILATPAPAWIVAGTITPTEPVDLQLSDDTRWSAARKLAAATGSEAWLTRISSSQFALQIGTRGGTSPVVRIRTAHNLIALERAARGDPVTLAQGVGTDVDEGKASLAFAFWRVTALSGNVATLGPLHGAGPGPIAFAGQGTDFRTPNLVANPDPSAATPVGTPVITRDAFVGGGYTLHDIRDDSNSTLEYLTWPVTVPAGSPSSLGMGWVVKKGITHVAPDYLQLYDATAATWRLSLEVTWDGGGVPSVVAGFGTFVDAIALGDGVYFIRGLATGVVPANTHQSRLIPGGAAAANLARIYYADHVLWAASTAPARREPWYLEKTNGTVTQVTATDESTQEVTVGYVTGLSVGDRVRFLATGQGRHLTALELPERATLGDRLGKYVSEWDDSEGFPDNPILVDYTNPATYPDGYTGLGTAAKVTAAGAWLTGGQACQVAFSYGPGAPSAIFRRSTGVVMRIRKRRHKISATCWIRITALTNGQIGIRFTRNGVAVAEVGTYRSPINVWRQLKADGLDFAADIGTSITLNVEIVAVPDDGALMTATVIVDSLMWTPAYAARAIAAGSGAARIWQQTNEWAAAIRGVPAQYRLEAADLERLGLPRVAAIEPGGMLLADDDDLGLRQLSLRVRRRERDLLSAALTKLEVATSHRFTSRLATYQPPVIPFFEPIAVQATVRDERQAGQNLKAQISATTGATVTITLTHSDLHNGSPQISYAVAGATYVSGSGLGPYVFNRPSAGAGVGRVVFTAKLPGRSDVTDAVDVPEIDYLDVGNIVPFLASDAGSVSARLEGSGPTLSWRYVVSTSSMPADATVDAASPVDGRSLDLTALATLDFGQTLFLKARAYTAAAGGGVASAYLTATYRRDNKSASKVIILPVGDFVPADDGQTFFTFVPAFTFGAFPTANAYVITPGSTGGSLSGFIPITLPPGVTITKVRARLARLTGGGTAVVRIEKINDSGDINATVATLSQGGSTSGWVDSGTISHAVVATHSYVARIDLANDTGQDLNASLAAIEITYTAPTLVTTV